ncbi:ribosome maturation factor RimP, partial [Gordonia alkanivorans]|uniref:ribosome maturation factor RimP n=1 Tax=Gordonia alkanivorans TaxID=84096 RepID=UPI003D2A328E|nr:ribosome maturation factor RimP [Gordonia alkanivorans]
VPELTDADAYDLEVTSPGVDRPLTLPRHWRRNTGRRVAGDVAPLEGSEERSLTGRSGKLDETNVEIVMNLRGR